MTKWTTKEKVERNRKNAQGHANAKKQGLRYCPKCEMAKPHSNFEFPQGSRVQKAWCKECRAVKQCPKCKRVLPRATHYQQLNGKGPRANRAYCLDCDKKYQRRWKLNNLYGMPVEEYKKIYDKQRGKCKICKQISDKTLRVDHSHATGAVRGLLCDHCNRGIGFFFDSPKFLRAAADYLEDTCE